VSKEEKKKRSARWLTGALLRCDLDVTALIHAHCPALSHTRSAFFPEALHFLTPLFFSLAEKEEETSRGDGRKVTCSEGALVPIEPSATSLTTLEVKNFGSNRGIEPPPFPPFSVKKKLRK
jgi:hypothetical protein